MPRAMRSDFGKDVVDIAPVAAVKGVFGIAPHAAQRATREAHEYRAPADRIGLALDRVEDLGDAQTLSRRRSRRGQFHACVTAAHRDDLSGPAAVTADSVVPAPAWPHWNWGTWPAPISALRCRHLFASSATGCSRA